jgi:hypothetical protein
MINSITIGYVPENWSGNEEDEMRIEIGNPEFSKNKEVTFRVTPPGQGDRDWDIEARTIGCALYSDELFENFSKAIEDIIGVKVDGNFRVVVDCYINEWKIDKLLAGRAISKNDSIIFMGTECFDILVNDLSRGRVYVLGSDEENEKDYLSLIKSNPLF